MKIFESTVFDFGVRIDNHGINPSTYLLRANSRTVCSTATRVFCEIDARVTERPTLALDRTLDQVQ